MIHYAANFDVPSFLGAIWRPLSLKSLTKVSSGMFRLRSYTHDLCILFIGTLYLPIWLPINNSYEFHGFFIARLAKSNHPSPTALPSCCHAQFEWCQAMDSAGRAGALVCEGPQTINRCRKLVLSTCSWLCVGVPILYPVAKGFGKVD